jgi:hypothetical protein
VLQQLATSSSTTPFLHLRSSGMYAECDCHTLRRPSHYLAHKYWFCPAILVHPPGSCLLPAACCLLPVTAHVNVVIVGFARPDCTYVKGSLDISYSTTGLIFDNDFISATGAELKAGIAALKAAQNNTRVLLSVGGGSDAYNNWAAINTNCLKALVDDVGFQGVAGSHGNDVTNVFPCMCLDEQVSECGGICHPQPALAAQPVASED